MEKIPIDPSVVETLSECELSKGKTCLIKQTTEDTQYAMKAKNLEQKGRLALAFGIFFIASDIILALTFDTQMTINHVCPAFWLGLCLVGIGLCSLMLGYRDREDLREGEKKRRPSKARIGYYIFLIASILIMAVIITTHVAALFIKDPSLRMDIVVVLFRLLLLTTVSPSLLAIWLLYQRLVQHVVLLAVIVTKYQKFFCEEFSSG